MKRMFLILFLISSFQAFSFEPEQVVIVGQNFCTIRLKPHCVFHSKEDSIIYVGGAGCQSKSNASFFYPLKIREGIVPKFYPKGHEVVLSESNTSEQTHHLYLDKDNKLISVGSYATKNMQINDEYVKEGMRPLVMAYNRNSSYERTSYYTDTSTKQPYIMDAIATCLGDTKEIFSLGGYRKIDNQLVNSLSISIYSKEGKFLSEKILKDGKKEEKGIFYEAKKMIRDEDGNFYVIYKVFHRGYNNQKYDPRNTIMKVDKDFKIVWEESLDFIQNRTIYSFHAENILLYLNSDIFLTGYYDTGTNSDRSACVYQLDIKTGKKITRTAVFLNGGVLDGIIDGGDDSFRIVGSVKKKNSRELVFINMNASLGIEYMYTLEMNSYDGISPLNIIEPKKGYYLVVGSGHDAVNILFNDRGTGVEVHSKNVIKLNAIYNAALNINYSIEKAASVKLIISDYLGNQMSSESFPHQIAGDHEFKLDKDLPNGAYLVSMEVGGQMLTKKVMVVK